jgi:hypothetical protein
MRVVRVLGCGACEPDAALASAQGPAPSGARQFTSARSKLAATDVADHVLIAGFGRNRCPWLPVSLVRAGQAVAVHRAGLVTD